jgi:mono/diheme cytochrome c family protein
MKKALKGLGWVVFALVLLGAVGFGYIQATWDRDFNDVPLPPIHASKDSAVIARGEYLVRAVAHCSGCHALASDPAAGILGPLSGGFVVNAEPFGTFVAANLTSDSVTGLGSVSDGAIARVLRTGVMRDGRAAPIMMTAVGPMADEDLTAIVSYLRTQAPVIKAVPGDEWGLVAKALSGILTPRSGTAPPFVAEGAISVERGRYLALGPGACGTCHTPTDRLFRPNGPALSGNTLPQPDEVKAGYEFVPPNLTPDSVTGQIAAWSEDQFVRRFKQGRIYPGSRMPWDAYQRLTENDVRSLSRFLHSLSPVRHLVGPAYRKTGDLPTEP